MSFGSISFGFILIISSILPISETNLNIDDTTTDQENEENNFGLKDLLIKTTVQTSADNEEAASLGVAANVTKSTSSETTSGNEQISSNSSNYTADKSDNVTNKISSNKTNLQKNVFVTKETTNGTVTLNMTTIDVVPKGSFDNHDIPDEISVATDYISPTTGYQTPWKETNPIPLQSTKIPVYNELLTTDFSVQDGSASSAQYSSPAYNAHNSTLSPESSQSNGAVAKTLSVSDKVTLETSVKSSKTFETSKSFSSTKGKKTLINLLTICRINSAGLTEMGPKLSLSKHVFKLFV